MLNFECKISFYKFINEKLYQEKNNKSKVEFWSAKFSFIILIKKKIIPRSRILECKISFYKFIKEKMINRKNNT